MRLVMEGVGDQPNLTLHSDTTQSTLNQEKLCLYADAYQSCGV